MSSTPNVSVVAIAGISGKLGTLVAESLLKTSQVEVRGFCRDKSKVSTALSNNPRVSIVEGQSDDPDATRRAVRGSDVVICCYLGSNELMLEGQKLLIDVATAEKVPRFMASDYSLDYRKLELGQLPSKDPMLQVRDYLQGKSIEGIHIMIGCFIETFWQYLGVWDAKNYELSYWGEGSELWEFTTYGTAAEYMAAVALDPTASGFLKFRSDFLSMKDIAQLLGKRYGSPPRMKSLGSMEQLRQQVDAHRAKGNVGWDVMPLFYIYFIQNGQTYLGGGDNPRYPGVKPQSMEDYIAANDLRNQS